MEIRLLFLEIQAGIAVLMVLFVRFGMRKLPRAYSYMLWLLVFARLLFPVSFESRFGLMPSASDGRLWTEESLGRADLAVEGQSTGGPGTVFIGNEGDAAGRIPGTDSGMGIDDLTQDEAGTDSYVGVFHMPGETTGEVENNITVIPYENRQPFTLWKIVLLILWAAGAAAILIYNGAALLTVKKQIKGAEHFKDNIYICSQVKAPFTLGMFWPKIYLPANLAEEERKYIICHERIHIRRKDYLVKNIAFLLTAFHWFNPFIWVAFCFMEKDMEMSCDEKVIRELGAEIKRQYSQSLLDFAEGKCPAAVTPITFGENSVKQRVSNVLAYKAASRRTVVLGTVIILVSAVMIFTVRSDAQGRNRETQSGNRQESGAFSGAGSEIQISAEGSSLAVRNVGASADIISLSLVLAQSSPYSALEYWARAFTDRNGDILFRLAADQENFKQWEMVTQGSNGSFVFGESSPWPWEYDYEITVSAENSTAEIIFHMRTSVPEIYLLKEKVRITGHEGLYYVDHQSTWDNYSIETAQEYREAYGTEAAYDGDSVYSRMAALYEDSFYCAILTHLMEGDNPDYRRFTDPVSAAEELLHLGEGTGEVTERDMVPVTSLRSADLVHSEQEDIKSPGWISALSMAGEGSRVMVSYTFARDDSCIEIPMELKEGSRQIWGLAGGGIREIYSRVGDPGMMEHEEGKADLTYVIELSNYGIYRLGAHSGLTCLWPGDVGPEAAARVYEDKLYIFESPERAKENSDDGTEAVFVLELLTGELHREHLAIPRNYEQIFPGVSFGMEGGFVHIYGFGSKIYSLPLENLNETLWNHKTFRQMSEEDKQVYGVENREYLLNHPDTLVRLSVRESEQTYVYIDLDGDGISEQVILSADPGERGQYWGYDAYRLQVGESVLTGLGNRLHNDIWAYSPDGEQIILALFEDGPSDDPRTCLFGYENGELKALGELRQDIRACDMEKGVISGTARSEMIQTDATNLFQYAVEMEDEVFSPKEVKFFMSIEEVLQAAGLNEDAVSEWVGGKRILTNINIAGFPDDIMKIYTFSDDIDNRLITVEYRITVDEAEAADLYNLLYEQAGSTMPVPIVNTIEGIKNGEEVAWEDKEQNYVRLTFAGTNPAGADNLEVIILSIHATRNI